MSFLHDFYAKNYRKLRVFNEKCKVFYMEKAIKFLFYCFSEIIIQNTKMK